MKKILLAFLVMSSFMTNTRSQGCIAIRNLAGFGEFAQLGYGDNNQNWMVSISNRYFKSWNLYSGKEQKGADGINLYEYEMNVSINHNLKKGWSYAVNLPIAANKAAAGTGPYNSTQAFGIGDIRVAIYKWVLNTEKYHRGNIQVGLGVKLPTGNYHYEDYWYPNPNDGNNRVLGPVNVAIQLGDGGTGITSEINAYYLISNKLSIDANLFYLISPRDVNGVSSFYPGQLDTATAALFHKVTYDDLIGHNDGLRRVGYIFSVEPGLQYKFPRSFLYVYTGFPLVRATIQTVPDKRIEEITGQPTITPGHFANFLIYFGYAFTF